MIAPDNDDLLIRLAKKQTDDNQIEILQQFKQEWKEGRVKPVVASEYPTFQRQIIKTKAGDRTEDGKRTEGGRMEATTMNYIMQYAYGGSYNLKLAKSKPKGIQ